ncbi:MAG: Asp-tRNA(Asn)/Glu-tRNA(Gln) amidotransferase subunit GatC [Thauera sp.]|jgi:aspartyl-tRNA(Asn)/glutamyl-tRNA(Gln) amidotransferase subunit C|nr:Asp-tRNA(Asn)/Glu-tRNA(Gln) amidotransferase subunit GatC [Thauera sp.]
MSLLPEQTGQLARLARLEMAADEIKHATDTLNRLLQQIASLQDAVSTRIEPMSHPHAQALRLRADVVTETDQHQLFQSIAPLTQDGLYLVPKMIE